MNIRWSPPGYCVSLAHSTAFGRRTAFDQWYISQSTANAHIAKTILVTTGESVGYDLLVGRKHVDRVVAGTTERFQPW